MPSILSPTRARVARIALAAALAAVGACQPVNTRPEPAVAALVVRNTSAFDVNVFAEPGADAKPVWLGTIGSSSSRSLSLPARILRTGSTLIVRTKAIGASSEWTSESVFVGNGDLVVLDVSATSTGNCAGSQLYAMPLEAIVAPKR